MMDSSNATVLEKFREFDRTATQLDMPRTERLLILNVSEEAYVGLRHGMLPPVDDLTCEVKRRMSYALPTMRRLANNPPNAGAPAQLHAA